MGQHSPYANDIAKMLVDMLRDDPELMRALAAYSTEHERRKNHVIHEEQEITDL